MVPMRSTNDLVRCNVLEKQQILGVELNCHRASGKCHDSWHCDLRAYLTCCTLPAAEPDEASSLPCDGAKR